MRRTSSSLPLTETHAIAALEKVSILIPARPLLAIILLCAISCRTAAPPVAPGTLVVALESAPAILDPRYTTDANSSLVSALVTSGLTRTNDRAEAVPDLAAGWQQVSPLEYRFTLRGDAAFGDGAPVTANDVVATYRAVLDPALGAPKREALTAIADIDAPDARTIVVRLRAPTAAFLETANLGILPAELARRPQVPPAEVVGAGPFRVAATFADGSVELAAAPSYMDGAPALPRVRFRVIPDGTVRALELASGGVHLAQNALEPDLLPWLASRTDLELVISPGTRFQYLGMNFRDPRLADRRVRQALACAVDRETIVRQLLRDTARPATGLLPPSHWAYTAEVPTHPYEPERAAALLTESGLGADTLEAARRFSYKTSTVELPRRIAEVFQAELGTIGLVLDVRSYEWATFYADIVHGDFQLYSLAWVGVADPDVYYRIFHSRMRPPDGNNRGAYANPTMDALLEAARTTLDRDERRQLYAEVQRLAAEDLPVIPLWWVENVVVKSRRLVGFVPSPDGDLRSLARARLADR
jgi:peptide/nickel transport system substrate-binding protein